MPDSHQVRRRVAGAEYPWPLKLAQEGSAATTITRDISGLALAGVNTAAGWGRTPTGWVKGVTANSRSKLRVPGNQPGTGVKPPMRHHRREHRCHGRLQRPMVRERDAPNPRPSLDLGLRLFLRGWLGRINPMACKPEPRRDASSSNIGSPISPRS
jgi:hypothetical protein